MPDYPPAIITKAAEAIERELMSGRAPVTHIESDELLARAALDAVAADLGELVAAKILEFMESLHPETDAPFSPTSARSRWRRHLKAAARVAGRAFLTDEDMERMAAGALAAGNYIACRSLEDGGG